MKLDVKGLKNHLTKALAPLYLVSGDEPLQIRESIDLIRQVAKQNEFVEREVFHLDSNFAWDRFALTLRSYSLFSAKSMVELHFTQGKLPAAGEEIIKQYVEKPPKDKLLLLVTQKLDAGTQKKSWVQAAEKAGVFLQVWPIEPAFLVAWIQERSRSMGLTLDTISIRYLAEFGEGNLLAIVQALEKLLLVFPGGKPNQEQVMTCLSDSARFRVFDLADAVLLADNKRIVRLIEGLTAENTEPLLALWVLVKELKLLLRIKTANSEAIFQQLGIWPKRIPLYKKAANRVTREKLEQGLVHAQQLDNQIKSSQNRLVWDEITQIALCFS